MTSAAAVIMLETRPPGLILFMVTILNITVVVMVSSAGDGTTVRPQGVPSNPNRPPSSSQLPCQPQSPSPGVGPPLPQLDHQFVTGVEATIVQV